MRIVIDISEERYKDLQRIASVQIDRQHFQTAEQIIVNGTPLPKGHGRLIDAEALDMKRIDYIVDGYANDKDDCTEFGMMSILAPTLVEADGGDAE